MTKYRVSLAMRRFMNYELVVEAKDKPEAIEKAIADFESYDDSKGVVVEIPDMADELHIVEPEDREEYNDNSLKAKHRGVFIEEYVESQNPK